MSAAEQRKLGCALPSSSLVEAPCCVCYLQGGGLPVNRSDQDHQHVVDAQVAKDVTLGHRDVQPQHLQHVLHRLRAVLVQLKTHNHNTHRQSFGRCSETPTFTDGEQSFVPGEQQQVLDSQLKMLFSSADCCSSALDGF